LIKAGSDHNPILLILAPRDSLPQRTFRFEPSWFLEPDFKDEVIKHWPVRSGGVVLDTWQQQSQGLRKFLKEWGANLRGEYRRERKNLTNELQRLDSKEGLDCHNDAEWRERYKLEKALMQLFSAEEVYWQQRSGEKWIVQGDAANTSFFFIILLMEGRGIKISLI
jgi:hypothetical protein